MKTLFLALVLTFGSNAFAVSIDDFCSQFSWDSEKIACFKTANNGFVDGSALDVCNSFSWDSEKMECLKSVLNKTYTFGEVKTCRDLSFDSEKVNCLKTLGRKYEQPDERKMQDIRKLTITAQDALRMNDLLSVRRALDYILQLTNYPIK